MTSILFYEDIEQLKKITSHTDQKCIAIVHYEGRQIRSYKLRDEGIEKPLSFLTFINISLRAKLVECEYPNGVVRFWAWLFRIKIRSHIFGVIDKSSIYANKFIKINILKKLITRVYADEYIIYGQGNPTKDLGALITHLYGSKVTYKQRVDLPNYKKLKPSHWVLYVGQPWEEIGRADIEMLQKFAVEQISKKNYKVIYCSHPREKKIKYSFCENVSMMSGCLDRIEKFGPPVLAISITSSLIYELSEMGINSQVLADRFDLQFQLDKLNIDYIDLKINSFLLWCG